MTQERRIGIYRIQSQTTGKVYVGSSKDIDKRWSRHRYDLSINKHHSSHLQRAWNKYGSADFVFEILELVADVTVLISREQVWIDLLRAADHKVGFNCSPLAGRISNVGRVVTQETRDKLAAARRGKRSSAEWRAKIGDAHRGSKSHRAKLSEGAVREIKALLQTGAVQRDIAKMFSVTASAVTAIRKGKTWSHVAIVGSLPPASVLGSRHWNSRLDEAQVRDIKQLLSTRTITQIATEFGVGSSTIADIAKGRTWSHIEK